MMSLAVTQWRLGSDANDCADVVVIKPDVLFWHSPLAHRPPVAGQQGVQLQQQGMGGARGGGVGGGAGA